MRRKLILMVGGTETLDFFSRELDKAYRKMGYETFLFDQRFEEESAEKLYRFAEPDNSILLTFNFDGIHYETSLFDACGNYIWNQRNIPCVNIAVDHPFYYPELFQIHPKNFYQVSIDRFHDLFIRRFYPDIQRGPFLPLAGTSLYPDGDYLPVCRRPIDIVFTGNYTAPETFEPQITRLGKEYEEFYRGILDELITHPDLPDDYVMEKHLLQEMPDATTEELLPGINSMLFLDICIRFHFRGLVVRTLADAGLKVHCIGKGWDKLACRHPENLTWETGLLSYGCLVRQSQAKLSLNVMPWFKDGAHDRIFNAMANGSVCVTDTSKYLREQLEDNKTVLFYELSELSRLPEQIKDILGSPSRLEEISRNAFSFTMKHHTWQNRARQLHDELFRFL